MRRMKWGLRQLVPTKFATAYRRVDGQDEQTMQTTPMFCTWWMWLGRCFRVHRIEI